MGRFGGTEGTRKNESCRIRSWSHKLESNDGSHKRRECINEDKIYMTQISTPQAWKSVLELSLSSLFVQFDNSFEWRNIKFLMKMISFESVLEDGGDSSVSYN